MGTFFPRRRVFSVGGDDANPARRNVKEKDATHSPSAQGDVDRPSVRRRKALCALGSSEESL